jgi:hypothetical protein
MIHRDPENVPPLFARPADPPKNDAAPSGNGASVNDSSTAHDRIRLPLVPPARRNAPPGTSSVAAERIVGHAAKQRAEVFAVILKAGAFGATDAEIELATGIRAQSVSPRRGELGTLGMVIDSGRRRPTPSGRPAAVWIASTLATIHLGGRGDGGAGAATRENDDGAQRGEILTLPSEGGDS